MRCKPGDVRKSKEDGKVYIYSGYGYYPRILKTGADDKVDVLHYDDPDGDPDGDCYDELLFNVFDRLEKEGVE